MNNKTNYLELREDDKGYYFVNKKGQRSQYFETKHKAWGASITGELRWRKLPAPYKEAK